MSYTEGCPTFSEEGFLAFKHELELNTDSVVLVSISQAGDAAQERRRKLRGHRRQSAVRSNREFEAHFNSLPSSSDDQPEITVPCNTVIPTIVVHTTEMTEAEDHQTNMSATMDDANLGEAPEVQDHVHEAAKSKALEGVCDRILAFLKQVLRLD